jgi:PIN like domain
MTNIYLDENLSEYVAQALNFLNKGYFRDVQVFSTKEHFGKGVKDEVIIPGIGKEEGVLITRDINIHKTKFQYELCKLHKIGVFFLAMPKNQNKHWEMVKLLVVKWEDIIEKITQDRKPFAYRIKVVGKIERM